MSTIIEVVTASQAVRGFSCAAASCDELGFWPSEDGTTPDVEIIAAAEACNADNSGQPPALRQLALRAARRSVGSLSTYYGQDDPSVLVWSAEADDEPSVPKRVIDLAYEADPASAAAEDGAEFRIDVESHISREAAEACVSLGVRERAPVSNLDYIGFVDPSAGSARALSGWRDS